MSYTRAEAAIYVATEHATLLDELGVSMYDEEGGLKSILDRSFRALGVSQSDLPTATVADGDVGKLEAALDYYTLLRLQREAAGAVAISKTTAGQSISKQRQQLYDHLTKLVEEAKDRCDAAGVLLDGSGAWAVGSINLDFLEPEGEVA